MKGRVFFLACLFFVGSWVSLGTSQDKPVIPGDLYDIAIDSYYKEAYEEAIGTFTRIIRDFPKSNLVSYSQFMIGQCYLKMGRDEEAIRQFELYLKTYPEGDRVKGSRSGIEISKERLEKKAAMKLLSEAQNRPVRPLGVKRRICAQVFYFDGKTLDQVEKKIKALKETGVDTLLFRVFQNKGDRLYKFVNPRYEEGVYFKTEQAPVVDDILGKIVEVAHRNGLEIFAWMTTRYANFGLDGYPELRCKSYNFETKKLEVARGFNLFRPEIIHRLESLFQDLGRYPIDGILFQDDLILKHNEGFSAEANKAFFKEFGTLPHPDQFYIDPYRSESGKYYVKAYSDQFWTWANWKSRWLMTVAQRLMAAAKKTNPTLKFGINLYYETVLNDSNSVAWFSQSLREAMGREFDYYAIMAYHRQTMKELNMEAKKAVDLMAEVTQKSVQAIGDPARVMMKVQVLDWKSYEVIPAKEVGALLDGILSHGGVSLAFVPYIDAFPFQQVKAKWMSSQPSR